MARGSCRLFHHPTRLVRLFIPLHSDVQKLLGKGGGYPNRHGGTTLPSRFSVLTITRAGRPGDEPLKRIAQGALNLSLIGKGILDWSMVFWDFSG
jgi:hypothetical protein